MNHGSLTFKEGFAVFDSLYKDLAFDVVNTISKTERLKYTTEVVDDNRLLTYGEVNFISLSEVLRKYAFEDRYGIFVDLGSGSGKPVFSAILLQDNIRLAIGIELVEELHNVSIGVLERYQTEYLNDLPVQKQKQVIQFLCGNIFDINWSNADILFVNATCFSKQLIATLELQCRLLAQGSLVIISTKPFAGAQENGNEYWELLEKQSRRMSWGKATVFVFKRK